MIPLAAQATSVDVPQGWVRVWIGLGLWGISLLSAGWAWASREVANRDRSWGSESFASQSVFAVLVSIGAFVGGCVLTIRGLIEAAAPIGLAVLAPLVPVALVLGGWRLELARRRLVAREAAAREN